MEVDAVGVLEATAVGDSQAEFQIRIVFVVRGREVARLTCAMMKIVMDVGVVVQEQFPLQAGPG